jgi:hypothetical protein
MASEAAWYGWCRGPDANFRSEVNMSGYRIIAASAAALVWVVAATAQTRESTETFTAVASLKTAGGAAATAPVTIVVARKVSSAEADAVAAAFAKGGTSALRKALVGLPDAGSVQIAGGKPTTTRLVLERPTDKGRLLTIVIDQPILFLGAGVPGATAKEGFDFAVVDIEVDEKGTGSGTLYPAAKIEVRKEMFVVGDYSSELLRLTDVKKVK